MKAMRFAILSACAFSALSFSAFAQADAKASQAEAVRQFPDLTKAGSDFNKAFVAKLQAARAAKDRTLFRSDWPMIIANAVASELGVQPVAQPEDPAKARQEEAARAQREAAEQWRYNAALEKIRYGVRAETTFLRDTQIEGRITIGELDFDTENEGLNQVKKRKYKFARAWFRPDKTDFQRVFRFPEELATDRFVRESEVWGIIEDVDTTSLLSDQVIYLEVYQTGTVERNERRYRKFTASKQKAIEFLKANQK